MPGDTGSGLSLLTSAALHQRRRFVVHHAPLQLTQTIEPVFALAGGLPNDGKVQAGELYPASTLLNISAR